jgi:branched-chain amino acid transport system permease protein
MRRMTGEAVLAALLMTIALGVLLRGIITLIWGAQTQNLGFYNPSIPLFGGRITLMGAMLFTMVFVIYGGLFAFLKFSKWGIQMRAAGQNPLLAAQRGINLHAVYALAWGLSTFTGAIAGMLLTLNSGLDGTMVLIGLKAFPAALVGGLDSLLGALVGSAIVAIAEVYTIKFDPLLAEVMPFIILILMLMVRPWGLFGTKEELNRV